MTLSLSHNMQRKYVITLNGQEVELADLQLVSDDASLADDKVLSEIFRLLPFDGSTVTKGVITYDRGGVVIPNGASGTVKVYPFRAMIGSTTTEGTNPALNRDDIRSTVSISPTTTAWQTVSFSNNSSGNPRWDLVYCVLTKDSSEAAVTRYVKSAGPPVAETATNISVVQATITALGVVTGVASATPALPNTPSDGAGNYYIPLAYVRVPNGFTGISTVLPTDILDISPIAKISKATGVANAKPAGSLYKPTGAPLSRAVNGVTDWGINGSISRPSVFMPPSMVGMEIYYVCLDCLSSSSANWSHLDGSVVDDTIDWRNRIFTSFISTEGSTVSFPWEPSPTSLVPLASASSTNTTNSGLTFLMAQSFNDEYSGGLKSDVIALTNSNSKVAASQTIKVYVDLSDGKLKFSSNSTLPAVKMQATIFASSQYPNR